MTKQTLPLELHWTASQLNPSDSWTWHTSPNAEIKCLVGTKSIILSNVYFSCMSNYHCYEKNHSFHYPVFFPSVCTVADPDLQIRGGGGYPDPEIRGGPGLPKNFFGPLGLILVKKWGVGSPLDPPLLQSHHNPLYIEHLLASDRTHWRPQHSSSSPWSSSSSPSWHTVLLVKVLFDTMGQIMLCNYFNSLKTEITHNLSKTNKKKHCFIVITR